jgi:hypothetical protein
VSTTCCIIGLGWGRASRVSTLGELAAPQPDPHEEPKITTGALATPSTEEKEQAGPTVGDLAEGKTPEEKKDPASVKSIGEEDVTELTADNLFDAAATRRIIVLWILTPSLSVGGSYLLFLLLL